MFCVGFLTPLLAYEMTLLLPSWSWHRAVIDVEQDRRPLFLPLEESEHWPTTLCNGAAMDANPWKICDNRRQSQEMISVPAQWLGRASPSPLRSSQGRSLCLQQRLCAQGGSPWSERTYTSSVRFSDHTDRASGTPFPVSWCALQQFSENMIISR